MSLTTNITSCEKAELLKSAIYQLYSKEGRSFSYIGRLLQIDRKTISLKVREWGFPEAEPHRHLTPSNQKFLNANRSLIKSRLDHDKSIRQIAEELNVSYDYLRESIITNDEVLKKAENDRLERIHKKAREKKDASMAKSSFDYDITDEPGEEWKDLLGYPGYQISNAGRVRSYSASYKKYHLLHTFSNGHTGGREYVTVRKDGKEKTLSVARLVAHAFCAGFTEERNTVNHKDGNVRNNHADNLEWMSQSENNKHSYEQLGRNKVRTNKIDYKIIYKDKYEFKTAAAFARFIGKSETQARRYLEEAEKYDIKIIDK